MAPWEGDNVESGPGHGNQKMRPFGGVAALRVFFALPCPRAPFSVTVFPYAESQPNSALMKQITIQTEDRKETGRSANKSLRREGRIPAVFYGESGNRLLSLNDHDFGLKYRQIMGKAALIELKMGGGDEDTSFAIIQELQRNPRSDDFVHVDFKEIVRGQEMEASIPLNTMGVADGVKNYGGVLEVSASELRVRCRPRHLPEGIDLDVSSLEIGRSIHLSEVDAPEGVTFLDDPDMVVVSCVGASGGASGAEEEEEGEAAAEEGAVAASAGEGEGSEEEGGEES